MRSHFIRSVLAAIALVNFATGPARGDASPASGASATRPAAPADERPATQPTPDPREGEILSTVTQLTDGFDKAGEGYFSADMKWIIFQAAPKGETEYQMYVASLDLEAAPGPKIGDAVRISPPNSRNTCGYFSPDGKSLLFASTAGKEKPDEPAAGYQREGGAYRWAFPDGIEIYQAKDWRSAVEKAGSDRTVDLARPANRLTENTAYDAEGAYSPDGRWIGFTSRRTGDTELWAMRADGSHPVQLTHAKGYDGGPFFSPDGKRMVYRSDRKGNDLLQVFVADVAIDEAGNVTGLKAERQLTDDANVNWGPCWHPDSRHIIFATSRHGHHNYELYAMRDDGTHAVRITYAPGFDGLPVFSPDGKWLMWSTKRSKDGTTQLFIARFTKPKEW